jgi:predicted permease
MRWRRRGEREEDLEREICAHLELEAQEQRDRGFMPEEARFAARRIFGNLTRTKEEVRHMWGGARWDAFIKEVDYAGRTLRKTPGFAITAILTLALGIGASTAVFSMVDSVLLRPLGYRESGRLVAAWERIPLISPDAIGPNPRHADLWQKRATAFSGLTLVRHAAWGLSAGKGHPRLTRAVLCLPNLFDVLQVRPLLGRGAANEDDVKRHQYAILTYPLWQSVFHGDPGALGKTIRLNDTLREVIGVLPAGFHFPNANALHAFRSKQAANSIPEPEVFLPTVLDLNRYDWNGEYGNWIALGRLKPGVNLQQAAAQLDAIDAQILADLPASEKNSAMGQLRVSVQPLQDAVVGDSKTGLWLLMAAVMGLMLIACLNLANAQLGRALARSREAAVRTALGAGKWRLLGSCLAENFLLAVAGGAAGVLLAAEGVRLLRLYPIIDLPRLSEVRVNPAVLLFSIALTGAASVLSGLLPAVRLLRTDPQAALQKSARALGSRQGRRLRAWLIGLQVFGSTVLLLTTGLFAKSLLHLLYQDKGFETQHVAAAEVVLSSDLNRSDQTRLAFDEAVLANLRALPGVQTASLVSAMPLEGESWIEGLSRPDRPGAETLINLRWVSAGYFETLRQKLVAGRFFEEQDRSRHSAVLSESSAKALWGSGNPLGQQVTTENRKFTVIGVVADSLSTSLKTAPVRTAYLHYQDRPPAATFFLVRAAGSPDTLFSSLRQAIWKYSPDLTIARIKTLDSQLSDSLAPERFQTAVLLVFGGAALFLAMLGIYAVLSYSVVTRKQEIGLRVALGATSHIIYALLTCEAGVPVLGGMAAGLMASFAAARGVRKLLFGAQTVEPLVIAVVAGLFLLSAAAAAFLPARRAASVDPMDALRSE